MINNKYIHFYQKLSTLSKVIIPILLASFFGVILTVILGFHVEEVDKKTDCIEKVLIPSLEKSTQNLAHLSDISERLIYAVITDEADDIHEMDIHLMVERNLKQMINNNQLNVPNLELYLNKFQYYYKISTALALDKIAGNELTYENRQLRKDVSSRYNELVYYFEQLKSDLHGQIHDKTTEMHKLLEKIVIYTMIFVALFSFVLIFIGYATYLDYKDHDYVEKQSKELTRINQNLQESLEYAALMQTTILPDDDVLNEYTVQNMVCWQPKDSVGGDIYFVDELDSKQEVIIMVIDGVGHGVSGAFLTMLVKAIQTQIIDQINNGKLGPSPGDILSYFNNKIKAMLHQGSDSRANTGFDGSVMYYNRITGKCIYAGAKSPLYIVDNDHIEILKGDRKSVGFSRNKFNQQYTDYDVEIKKNAKYYMITDGMIDQEGPNDTRYGKERFKNLILENQHKFFLEQRGNMINNFAQFKGDIEQSDDITVLGMQFT